MAKLDDEIPGRIPRQFWIAKLWFLHYAYWNRLLNGLALSLTLGGVLFALTDTYFLGTKSSYLYLRLLIPMGVILLVPAIAVWLWSNETQGEIVLRWSRRVRLERVLFFFIFNVRALVRALGQLDRKLRKVGEHPSKQFPEEQIRKAVRKVRISLIDLERLVLLVADSLEAPSSTFLLNEHFKLRRNRLLRKVQDYRNATSDHHTFSSQVGGPREEAIPGRDDRNVQTQVIEGMIEAEERIAKARKSIVDQVKDVLRVTHPAIAREILRVSGQVGTNNMIHTLAKSLRGLHAREEGRARQKTGTNNVVRMLVKALRRLIGKGKDAEPGWRSLLGAVEATRTGGGLIQELLDLREDEAPDLMWWKRGLAARKTTTSVVAANFKTFLSQKRELLAKHRGENGRIGVATIGYSTAVRACLEGIRSEVGPVLILQCDPQTGDADDAMLAELEDLGIGAEVVEVSANVGGRLKEEVGIILFGFEAASLQGQLVHRQGLGAVLRPIRAFIDPNGTMADSDLPLGCAVGESWKVREFEGPEGGGRKVPPRMIYRPGIPFVIITDCPGPDTTTAAHAADQSDEFHLECCSGAWTTKLRS